MPGIRFPSSEIEKDNLRDSRGEQIRIENKETFASSEIEKDNLRESQGKQIRTENKESFESKVLKRKQHIVCCSCRCRRGFVDSLLLPLGVP